MATITENILYDRAHVLTDWHDQHVSRKMLRHLQVGNRVRITLIGRSNSDKSYYNAYDYVTITKVCGYGRYKGVIENPYYRVDENPVRDGMEVTFCRRNIVEVPLDWRGNKNLKKLIGVYRKHPVVANCEKRRL